MCRPKRYAGPRRPPTLLVLALVVSLLWTTFTVASQAQAAMPVLSILQADDAAYPQVRIMLAAADANGVPSSGLTAANFVVTEDNRPGDILSAQEVRGGVPMYLALALDTSGSMAGPPLNSTVQAAQALVSAFAPVDQAALIKFRSDVALAAPLSADHAGLVKALQGLQAGGDTVLYDAAHQAITLLDKTPPGRRAVVLFTDGEDTGSRLTLDDVVAQAQRYAVPLYVVGYGPNIKPAVLARLAQRTGGAFFQAPRLEDIPSAFAQVMDALRHTYEITYLANAQADGKVHELRVNLTGPGGTAQTTGSVPGRPGNLSAALKVDGAPARPTAEKIWQALGNPPVDASTALLSRKAALLAQPTGPGRLTRAVFSLDGAKLGEATAAPFRYDWDILSLAPGLHTVTTEITDHVGNRASAQAKVAIVPPAHVAFVEPADHATVTDAVNVTLAAYSLEADNGLSLKADGQELRRFTAAPYALTWTLWREAEGAHLLEAALTTAAGYVASAKRAITVGPHVAVQVREPAANADLSGAVNIQAQVNSDAPITEVLFKVGDREVGKAASSPYQAAYHTGDFPPGDYTVRVEARNTAGMTGVAEVPVRMTPASRTGALMVALVAGLLLLLVLPVAAVARRRRSARLAAGVAAPAPAGVVVQRIPAAWLIRIKGAAPEERYPLYPGENRLGRRRDFADVWLPETTVSRRHAIIRIEPGGATFDNLNAENPTLVDGKIVETQSALRDGDTIQIGDIQFEFRFAQGG